MKIKWLIIVSIVCVGIIYIIFMFTKQNTWTELQPQTETASIKQPASYPEPLPPFTPVNLVAKPTQAAPAKSAITIISQPAAAAEETALPIATSHENIVAYSEPESTTAQPAGITKIGKHPTRKEAQEMQSKGITLY